jgi:hypothetical protein
LPTVHVTLVEHTKKEGNSQHGTWVLNLFKDAAGVTYQIFTDPKTGIANKTAHLLNQPAILEYRDKPAKDPQYPPNKEIVDIQPDTSAPAVSEAPVASQAPPTRAAFALSSGDDRQIQIMRQSALERAIRWFGVAGEGWPGLYVQSEEFLHYFQTGEYPGKAEGPAKQSNEQAVLDEFAETFPSAA